MNTATNIIAFPAPEAAAPAKRSPWDFYTTKEIAAAIKAATGYNARQVSVRQNSSLQYVTVTVRDAAADVEKIKAACASMHTWKMDETDYVEGQSVHVEITREVKEALAAPFIAAVQAVEMPTFESGGQEIVPGVVLFCDGHNVYASDCNGNRGTYICAIDFKMKTPWAINAVALHVAQILAKQPAVKAA